MNTIKGFASLRSHINNDPNQIALLGELSNDSRTYRKDQRIFTKPSFPEVGLTVFTAKDENTHAPFDVLDAHADHVLDVIDWVREISSTGEVNADPESFRAAVSAHKSEILSFLDYETILEENGAFIPEYVEWVYYGIKYQIWFSDAHFQTHYDDFEHTVIAPINVINDLYRPWSEIATLVEMDVGNLILKSNTVTEDQPYSELVPYKVRWVDPDTGNSVHMTWLVAVYGPYGNNPVSIAEALKQYILDNSGYNAMEWYNVMPELFKPTEFVIIPGWNNYSIPDGIAEEGVYSPQLRYKDMMYLAQRFTYAYEADHIEEHLIHAAHIYKSLGFLAIGNDGNRDGIYSLEQKFPKFNLTQTTEFQFSSIDPVTREWMKLMHKMFITAEYMDETTPLEAGLARLKRGGITYLVSTYEGVNYLVVTKETLLELYGTAIPEDGG